MTSKSVYSTSLEDDDSEEAAAARAAAFAAWEERFEDLGPFAAPERFEEAVKSCPDLLSPSGVLAIACLLAYQPDAVESVVEAMGELMFVREMNEPPVAVI